MASKYIIYMHKNKINGMIYIGQTKQNPIKRWNNGLGYKSCTKFFNAIQEYGWENFEHIILETDLTLEEANEKEKYYIQLYHSAEREYGYNLTLGGKNYIPSEETLERLSESHKGNMQSAEIRKKISEANKGKHNRKHTEEEKRKMSKNRTDKVAVICLNTNQIFNSLREAADYANIKSSCNIGRVCSGTRKSAGKHPQTGEPLKWAYYKGEKVE